MNWAPSAKRQARKLPTYATRSVKREGRRLRLNTDRFHFHKDNENVIPESEIKTCLAGNMLRNKELLESLRGRVALDHPRLIMHHFWAATQQSAALLAREMYDRDYLITEIAPVEAEDGERIWSIEASIERTPNDAASDQLTKELTRQAAHFDSEYDGWGITI